MGRNPGYGQHDILANHLGIDLEITAIAFGIFCTGLVQAGRQLGGFVGHQGCYRRRRDLVGRHAAGQRDDFGALAFALAPGKGGHNGAVAFFGNHHRVAAIQRQVVVGHRVVFEVIRNGITAGFFGGVDQQLEVPGQWQLFFLDDFHGVHRHHDAVFVILRTAPVHTVTDQCDLERVELGAVLEYPVFRGYRHYVGVGMNTDHFIATAFEGDFIDTVVDIAKVQVKGLGQILDLVGDLEKLRVLVLGHVVQVDGGDGHQFTQGVGSRLAVFEPGIQAQQAIDLVLLLGGQCLVVEKGADGRAEIIFLRQLTLGQRPQKLTEVSDMGVAERLEDDSTLLRGDGGVGCSAERSEAGHHHGCSGQLFK